MTVRTHRRDPSNQAIGSQGGVSLPVRITGEDQGAAIGSEESVDEEVTIVSDERPDLPDTGGWRIRDHPGLGRRDQMRCHGATCDGDPEPAGGPVAQQTRHDGRMCHHRPHMGRARPVSERGEG